MSPISETIFIDNGCGQIFFFKDIGNDIEEWFELNKIYDVVNNDLSSCEWGIYEKLTVVEAPDDGYIPPEDDMCQEFQSTVPSPPKAIYISNGCGQLFVFKDIGNILDIDVEEWFEANEIYKVVNNNLNSCLWGDADKLLFVSAPDADGWIQPES